MLQIAAVGKHADMSETNSKPEEDANDQPATFEGVVAEFETRLLRYATRIVNDINAAQDIVQTTFIKLFRGWKADSRPAPQLSAWLYRVTHNAAVDYLRKETRRRSLLQRHADEWDCMSQASRTGERISEPAERAARLLRCLPLRDQQLVILKVYEEKSYREMSEITGLSETNVGYILHFAMKKLASLLKASAEQERTNKDQ